MPIKIYDDTQTLHDIGSYIMSYQPYQNAFVNAMVNRIGMVLVTSKLWENPWSVFKRGFMEYGETIEEVFVNIAKPHSYNPSVAETKIFEREIPDIRAAFHTLNFQKFYKQTVQEADLRLAFLAWSGITDLIARIVDAMYTGMAQDEYTTMKYMVCREAISGRMYTQASTSLSAANAMADNAKTLRSLSSQLTFNKTTFNQAGVYTHTDRRDQYLIVDTQFEANMDVDVLAVAFHMEKAEFLGHLIIVDSFAEHDTERLNELFGDDSNYVPFTDDDLGNLQDIHAIIVDRNWWMVFDNYQNMTQNYNGEGLYWNYWLHVWKTFSVSPFQNAVVVVEALGQISAIAVTPVNATLPAGGMLQFNAAVTSSGIVDKKVTWYLTTEDENGSLITPTAMAALVKSGTKVDASSGVLTIDPTETYDGPIIVVGSLCGLDWCTSQDPEYPDYGVDFSSGEVALAS